jgi:hypothetical protein
MTNQLPESLFEAHKWISAAGEWDEASANPKAYAKFAYEGAVENEIFDVSEQDLLDVIEWHKKQ